MAKSLYTREQQTLRDLLKNLRRQSNLTQEAVAARLQMPQSFVSKYESGERRLDVLELRQVCTVLGVSLPEFIQLLEKELKNAS